MKRFVCSRCSAPIRKWNAFCYSCGYTNEHLVRKLKVARIQRITSVIVLIIGIIILCNQLMLMPWQWGARKNRKVILEYATEHYPNAKIIEEVYPTAHIFLWNNLEDYIVFKWDDLEFGISAEFGKIVVDGYCGARAIAQFDKIIQDGFMLPRGIDAYTRYGFVDNYYELYPYTGGLSVRITIPDQGTTPQEVGWLYDFYNYWKNEGAFLTEYGVQIDISADNQRMYHINYINGDEFSNESAFYAAFKIG